MEDQIGLDRNLKPIDLPSFSFIDPGIHDEDHVTVVKHCCICN